MKLKYLGHFLIVFLCLMNSAFAGRFHWNPYSLGNPQVIVPEANSTVPAAGALAADDGLNSTVPAAGAPAADDGSNSTVPAAGALAADDGLNSAASTGPQWVPYEALNAISERRGGPVSVRGMDGQNRILRVQGSRERRSFQIIPIVVGQISWGFGYDQSCRIGQLLAWLLQDEITVYGQPIQISGNGFPRLYGGIWIRVSDYKRLLCALAQRGVRLDRGGFEFARNIGELEVLREWGQQASENHVSGQTPVPSLPVPFSPVTIEVRRQNYVTPTELEFNTYQFQGD